jgi:hypothetical protein
MEDGEHALADQWPAPGAAAVVFDLTGREPIPLSSHWPASVSPVANL